MEYDKTDEMIGRLQNLTEILPTVIPEKLSDEYIEAIETATGMMIDSGEMGSGIMLDNALTWIAEHSETVDDYLKALKWIGFTDEFIETERKTVEIK